MKARVAWLASILLLGGCHRHADSKPSTPLVAANAPEPARPAAAARALEPEPEQAAPDQAAPEQAEAPSPGMARPANAAERAQIAQLSRDAETVRQLRLLRPIRVEIEDGDAIVRSLSAQIDESEIERARLIYGALGLIDPAEDLASIFSAVLGEQVIGYYDPETGRLVVRDDVMEGLAGAFGPEQAQEARLVLVHELVHALQDQRLGLAQSYEKKRTADADDAFRSVVEGDATLAMLAQALRQQGIPLSAATAGIQQMGDMIDLTSLVRGEKLDEAPAILRVTLITPYIRGLQFIAAVHGRGGWPAVNNAHRDPPGSMEQVLHPEKFFARERAEAVRIPDNPKLRAAGFERVDEDTLGELEIGVYLGQGKPSQTDEAAAEGWGGDRLVVYERGDQTAVVWWTTWDTERDAREAFEAARAVARRNKRVRVDLEGRAMQILHNVPPKLQRTVRADFMEFAEHVQSAPAPPLLPPVLSR